MEQLDEAAGGVVDQDLLAAGSRHDVARNPSPAAVSRSISARRSATIRWMRLRPAVLASSGGARACRPDSSRRSGPRTTSANAGPALWRRKLSCVV